MKAAKLTLRDYQTRAVRKVLKHLETHPSGLLVAPTGAGKTEMIAAIQQRVGGRMLIIQHLLDLASQNAFRMNRYMPGDVVTLAASLPKKAGLAGDASKASVVVGTISTVVDALPYIGRFDWLVIDEAHRSAGDTYETIARTLKRRNRALKLFGTTATPERADRKGIDHLFGDEPAAVIELSTLVGQWLVPPRVMAVPIDALRDIFEDTHGIPAEHRKKFSVSVVHEQVIKQWRKHAKGRKTVMFCADAEHARELAAAFSDAGISSASIDYQDAPGKRKDLLDELRAGRGPDVLCNPLLLTEGFDAPPVSCIGLLRPFASKSLYIQAIGRGLRLHQGKNNCLVLDYVGATHRHGDIVAGLNIKGREAQETVASHGVDATHEPLTVAVDDEDLEEVDIGIDARALIQNASEQAPTAGDRRIISRMHAMSLGLDRYFTGRMCASGHVDERFVTTTSCVGCCRKWDQERSLDPSYRAKKNAWRRNSTRASKRSEVENERRRARRRDPTIRALELEKLRAWKRFKMLDPAYRAKINLQQREWRKRKKLNQQTPPE